MALVLGDKLDPEVFIFAGPFVWTGLENVVREDVIVPKGWNNGDDKVIRRVWIIGVVGFPKGFDKLVDDKAVEFDDLFVGAGMTIVVVVSSRVTSPNDKVDLIF